MILAGRTKGEEPLSGEWCGNLSQNAILPVSSIMEVIMEIKNYECKCGSREFYLASNGKHTGIYCSECLRWFKWADKNERKFAEAVKCGTMSGKP